MIITKMEHFKNELNNEPVLTETGEIMIVYIFVAILLTGILLILRKIIK